MIAPDLFTETECFQKNKAGNTICGDSFLCRKLKAEGRVIAVLSDGLGSGIKANILSSLTTTMAVNYTALNEPILYTARAIIQTLPEDQDKQLSYSTFCLLDIDSSGKVHLAEYETPFCYLFRHQQLRELPRQKVILERSDMADTPLWLSTFRLEAEDRLICFTDGVSQSGLGSHELAAGWHSAIPDYIRQLLQQKPDISAHDLAHKIVCQAEKNDAYQLQDDCSCCVVYRRSPRNLLICTGPPYDPKNDTYLAQRVKEFQGKKIICGGTTAHILARELNLKIETITDFSHQAAPPRSFIDGFELVCEGIITLGQTERLLKKQEKMQPVPSPAEQLAEILQNSDKITFLVGTCINMAHQDPNLPVELEIRRNIVKRLKFLLEKKFFKDVEIMYL